MPPSRHYLTRCGIELADEPTVLQREALGWSLLVQVGDRAHSIGPDLATALRVQVPV